MPSQGFPWHFGWLVLLRCLGLVGVYLLGYWFRVEALGCFQSLGPSLVLLGLLAWYGATWVTSLNSSLWAFSW